MDISHLPCLVRILNFHPVFCTKPTHSLDFPISVSDSFSHPGAQIETVGVTLMSADSPNSVDPVPLILPSTYMPSPSTSVLSLLPPKYKSPSSLRNEYGPSMARSIEFFFFFEKLDIRIFR